MTGKAAKPLRYSLKRLADTPLKIPTCNGQIVIGTPPSS